MKFALVTMAMTAASFVVSYAANPRYRFSIREMGPKYIAFSLAGRAAIFAVILYFGQGFF